MRGPNREPPFKSIPLIHHGNMEPRGSSGDEWHQPLGRPLTKIAAQDLGATDLLQNARTFFTFLWKIFSDSCQISRNQIVFTMLGMICNRTEFCLVPNQSENDNYNLILV